MSIRRRRLRRWRDFGGCFNERGWTSLSKLREGDRESVLRELFDPVAGARFSLCRMPIGANDFALKAYSYDETKGDFELKHFSIENDRATLIPFIHAAQRSAEKGHDVIYGNWTAPFTVGLGIDFRRTRYTKAVRLVWRTGV
jgi:glucosylceramidase